MIEEFTNFAMEAGFTHREVDFQQGVVWHSIRRSGDTGCYDSPLPAGLHISCGIAKIQAHSKDHGGFQSHGPSVNLLHVPEGGAVFSSQLQSKTIHSFGFYLPKPLEVTEDPILGSLVDASRDKPMINIVGPILRSVSRLSSQVNMIDDQAIHDALLQARALELTALIAAELSTTRSSAPAIRSKRTATLVRDYIEFNLNQSLRLDDIASDTGIGMRTMTSAFREHFQETIAGYIRRRRMETAAIALEQGASVSEAAFLIGYTPNAFSRAYKAYFHIPPGAGITARRDG